MGILRTTIAIEHPARRGTMVELSDVIVDTGSEYTWVPQPVLESIGLAPERVVDSVTAHGRQIRRGRYFDDDALPAKTRLALEELLSA